MSATIEYRRGRRGVIVHAVVAGESAAVCGHRSLMGFNRPEPGAVVTCDRCRRKLGMGPAPAPRSEGGVR